MELMLVVLEQRLSSDFSTSASFKIMVLSDCLMSCSATWNSFSFSSALISASMRSSINTSSLFSFSDNFFWSFLCFDLCQYEVLHQHLQSVLLLRQLLLELPLLLL